MLISDLEFSASVGREVLSKSCNPKLRLGTGGCQCSMCTSRVMALFFHSIGEQQLEVRSQFKPVPSGLNVAQATSMVAKSSTQSTRP